MKKDSKGFTDTEALEIVGPKFDQVIAKLKASGYEEEFKSMQKKAPEPKTPVAKAKKIVQQAVKQPKTTSTKAKPTVGAFKKGAVGELAKQIRKDGEAWPSALKRAGQMIKEQKSGVQKKATAQYKKLTSLLAKMPELGKGTDVERDSVRKAKPIGKRTAKSGSTYYEYRANRTDVRQGKGYPYLKLGAMLAKGGEIEKIYDKVQMFDEITEKDLELGLRVQLKTLTPENAEKVARHLAMVGLLIEQDPDLAHRHALAAAERAGRIAMVREVVGVTAYTVGDYALGLRELLTHRRISGSNDQLPIIVDCERGLGRPERALEVGRSVDRNSLPVSVRVNLAIALSGARLDQNENELALAELQIPELNPAKVFDYSPPLFRAYADTLELLGRNEEAKRWFDLADRAELALAGNPGPEDEVFQVLEEIEIPVLSERKPWEPSNDSDRPRNFEPRNPRRDDERQTRSFSRDSNRQPRSFGPDSGRKSGGFGSGSNRGQGDSRGKGGFGGGRPGGARGR